MEAVRNLMAQAGQPDCLPTACYHCGIFRTADDIDMYAVQAWLLGVQIKAQRIETTGVFEGDLDETFLSRLARLPLSLRLVRDFLQLNQRIQCFF